MKFDVSPEAMAVIIDLQTPTTCVPAHLSRSDHGIVYCDGTSVTIFRNFIVYTGMFEVELEASAYRYHPIARLLLQTPTVCQLI